MITKEEIFKACKNTINKFKNIDKEAYISAEPLCAWIQTDPDKLKAKGIIEEVKFLANSIIECENLNNQKKKMKEIIFNEILTNTSLFPIIQMPDPENLNKINYFPYENISDRNLLNYTTWLINIDPLIAKIGITNEKSFYNAALIIQKYSISKAISSVFQECLIASGISNIRDKADALSADNFQNILKIIPLINNEGIVDDSKLDDEYKKNLLLKTQAEKAFLMDE
jgi:hypothetical protein